MSLTCILLLTEKLCSLYHLDIQRHSRTFKDIQTPKKKTRKKNLNHFKKKDLNEDIQGHSKTFKHIDASVHAKRDRGEPAVGARYIVTCILLLIVRE
jgi:hypothetical protein